jgi:chorismate mutase
MNSLDDFRKEIDRIDAALLDALGRRLAICAEVAHFKRAQGIPMMQPSRVEAVKDRVAALAAAHGLRPEFVRELYGQIIAEACRLEDDIIDAPGVAPGASPPATAVH